MCRFLKYLIKIKRYMQLLTCDFILKLWAQEKVGCRVLVLAHPRIVLIPEILLTEYCPEKIKEQHTNIFLGKANVKTPLPENPWSGWSVHGSERYDPIAARYRFIYNIPSFILSRYLVYKRSLKLSCKSFLGQRTQEVVCKNELLGGVLC